MSVSPTRIRHLVLAVQAAVTLGAVAGLAALVDWPQMGAAFARVSPATIAWAAALAALSQAVGAWRLSLILGACEVAVGFRRSLVFTWIGLFVGNVLPATVGADVLYAALLGRSGFAVGAGLLGLVCNRLINVAVILALLPWALTSLGLDVSLAEGLARPPVGALVLAALGVGVVGAGLALWGRRRAPALVAAVSARLREAWRRLADIIARPRLGLATTACSVVMLALGAWALLALARDLVPDTSYPAMAAILVVTLAVQMAPLSINGIGVQEAAFTFGLTHACGWSATDAMTFGLLARLLGILISLPGLPPAIVWLRAGKGG